MAVFQMVAIKDIALNDDRKEGGKGNIMLLAQSIAQVGLINPISVRRGGDSVFPYTIIAGRRRVEAAALLNHTEIAAIVYDEAEVAMTGFSRHLAFAENINRLEMHPLDEGMQYKRLVKDGLSIEQLRAQFDRSLSHIYQRMKLCDLTDEIKDLFRSGQMSITTAAAIASVPKEVQKAIYTHVKDVPKSGIEMTVSNCIMRQLKMPLDFSFEACLKCKRRTRYSDRLLFPEYADNNDYCLNARCYEKTKRYLYEHAIRDVLQLLPDIHMVYIYAELKDEAKKLQTLLDKPLISGITVSVYHADFEDCQNLTIVSEEELQIFFSDEKNLMPVLQFSQVDEKPSVYFAVENDVYEAMMRQNSNSDDSFFHEGETEKKSGLGYTDKKEILRSFLLTILKDDYQKGGSRLFSNPAFQQYVLHKICPGCEAACLVVFGKETEKVMKDVPVSVEKIIDLMSYSAVCAFLNSELTPQTVENPASFFSRIGVNAEYSALCDLHDKEQCHFLLSGVKEETLDEYKDAVLDCSVEVLDKKKPMATDLSNSVASDLR